MEEEQGPGRVPERVEFPVDEADDELHIAPEQAELEAEREKHRKRAEKFGTEYVDPSGRGEFRLHARKEKFTRQGFATGINLFTQEEVDKRALRAERFGTAGQGLEWRPPLEAAEDEGKRRQRAERFGVDYQPRDETGLMDVDLFEQRRDPDTSVERRTDTVHLYGVDLMSTGDCLKYFVDYGPTFVEWINDSSCNVTFRDADTARRAIAGTGRPMPPDESPGGLQEGMPAIDDPAAIDFLWHKGQDFSKEGSAIPVILRMATVEDAKPAGRAQSRRLWQSVGGGGGQQQRGRGR